MQRKRPTCPDCGRYMVRKRNGTIEHPRLSLDGWVWHAILYRKQPQA